MLFLFRSRLGSKRQFCRQFTTPALLLFDLLLQLLHLQLQFRLLPGTRCGARGDLRQSLLHLRRFFCGCLGGLLIRFRPCTSRLCL